MRRDKKRHGRKEEMISMGHGSSGNISVANVNIKRALLFESCCKIKKAIFNCGKMGDAERESEFSFPERHSVSENS